MADEKKFADEMLTDDELDKVSGGTYGEYKDLRDLIYSFEILRNSDAKKLSRSGLEQWLKDNVNVTADISTGFILNFSDDAGKTNTYRDNNKKKIHLFDLRLILWLKKRKSRTKCSPTTNSTR